MNQNINEDNVKSKTLSQEELMKTQVLNLKDVEAAIKYEKRTSKKPAIILAFLGFFAILLGTSFPFVNSMLTKKNTEVKTTRKIEKKKILNTESNLNCTYSSLNNYDGTDTNLNIQLSFNNDKLVRVIKNYTINPTEGSPLGPTTIINYINGYQPFLQQTIKGYQITVYQVNSGLVVTSSVDLKNFNLETFPELYKNNIATNVEYLYETDKIAIENDLITKGFSCDK